METSEECTDVLPVHGAQAIELIFHTLRAEVRLTLGITPLNKLTYKIDAVLKEAQQKVIEALK